MSTVQTQIRINADIKKQAIELFDKLGLDMSGAVTMFLHQCILRGGLPFNVELPRYSIETLEAMSEARRISRDDSVEAYSSMDELKKSLGNNV